MKFLLALVSYFNLILISNAEAISPSESGSFSPEPARASNSAHNQRRNLRPERERDHKGPHNLCAHELRLAAERKTSQLREGYHFGRTKDELAAELGHVLPESLGIGPDRLGTIAYEIIKNGEAFLDQVVSLGNLSLSRFVNGDGKIIYKYRKPSTLESRQGFYTDLVVAIDAKTGAIDANTPEGREFLERIFLSSTFGIVLIFADLNFLGVTNYFERSYEAGDDYLIAFGQAMRENLRSDDLIFKVGGDEFVFVLPILGYEDQLLGPELVQQLLARMSHSVQNNIRAREIFLTQKKILSKRYRLVNKANRIEDLDGDFVDSLSPKGKAEAKTSFKNFRKQFLASQKKLIKEMSAYRPSVSVGAAIVLPNGSFQKGLESAQEDARRVKVNFKKKLGLLQDNEKYGVVASDQVPAKGGREIQDRRRNSEPQPLTPRIIEP